MQHGFPVKVYEATTYLNARLRDWSILLHWGWPILHHLLPEALLDRLNETATTPHLTFTPEIKTFIAYHGPTGRVAFNNATPGGRWITRQKVRTPLSEGLQDDVKWCKTLSDIVQVEDNSLVTNFADGGAETADFVLDADVAKSTVWKWLFHNDEKALAVKSGCIIMGCIVNYHDVANVQALVDAHPVTAMMIGSGVVAGVGMINADNPADMENWTTSWAILFKQVEGESAPPAEGEEAIV